MPYSSSSRYLDSSSLPSRIRAATIWLDESGSPQTVGKCFVVGAIWTRHPDQLARNLRAVREQNNHYADEMKFGRIKDSNYRLYCDVVDTLEASDARLSILVVDAKVRNPFSKKHPKWETHADLVSMVINGLAKRHEVLVVAMDVVNTPPSVSMGQLVKRKVNGQIGRTVVVSAMSLDSKSTDLLQAADLVAGAAFHQRFHGDGPTNEKGKIAGRLAVAFGADSFKSDGRGPRLTIQTLGRPLPKHGTGAPH